MKDYFGKRSLLLGMSESHLVLSSVPLEELVVKEEVPENVAVEDEN